MHSHHTEDIDWDALSTQLAREAELRIPSLKEVAGWLRDLLGADDGPDATVRRILDVGCGPGVASCLFARFFPSAEVVAVDQDPGMLTRTRIRAAEQRLTGRVVTQQAELPDEFDTLSPAELIWSSNAVHHLGDQQAALNALAATLRPGGLLAVAERGLTLRFLPRDIGMGRPGLQARLDAALEDWFDEMRTQLPGTVRVVEDWPAMLAGAGLIPTGSRTFLTDLPTPLGTAARELLHTRLTWLRDRISDRLEHWDRLTLERLVDGDACTGILWRPDAFYLAATTVHTARSCPTA